MPRNTCPMQECENIRCHSCKTSAAHAAGLFYDTSDDSNGQFCEDCLEEVSENIEKYTNVKKLIFCPADCENTTTAFKSIKRVAVAVEPWYVLSVLSTGTFVYLLTVAFAFL